MSGEAELDQVRRFLREHSTLALATVSAEGVPYATPLFYCCDEECSLYWFSAASSLHSQHLEREPRVAVTVYREVEEWREIQGVQMQGSAVAVEDRELRKSITRQYVERFDLGNVFRLALKASTLYRFRPAQVRYLDNAQGFGHKREFSLS